jgi:hypothetical protein
MIKNLLSFDNVSQKISHRPAMTTTGLFTVRCFRPCSRAHPFVRSFSDCDFRHPEVGSAAGCGFRSNSLQPLCVETSFHKTSLNFNHLSENASRAQGVLPILKTHFIVSSLVGWPGTGETAEKADVMVA